MGKRTGFRQELQETGRLIGLQGVEWGRLNHNDLYIINEPQFYLWLLKASVKFNGTIPMRIIYTAWSATGGYGFDPYVGALLSEMSNEELIDIVVTPEGQQLGVRPKASISKALKVLPEYITRAEAMAGLEPVEEED